MQKRQQPKKVMYKLKLRLMTTAWMVSENKKSNGKSERKSKKYQQQVPSRKEKGLPVWGKWELL